MSITLLCGPAGSGKTHRVLEELRALLASPKEIAPRFLVVVPTYSQAEHLKRRLLKHTKRDALLDRGIATFEQLAERRTGLRLSALAPPAVRDAVLASAFADVAPPELARAARFPGLRRAALRFLDEVKALEPVPGEDPLTTAAARIGAAASAASFGAQRAAKVAGLLDVLAEYDRRLAAAGLRDHGDLVRALLAHLRDAPPQPLVLLAIDGFTDLTDVQEKIVQRLTQTAERTIATVLCDPVDRSVGAAATVSTGAEGPDGAVVGVAVASPFASSERLRSRLAAQGMSVGRSEAPGATAEGGPPTPAYVAETLRPGQRFKSPALAQLERRLAGELVPDLDPAAVGGTVRFLGGADAEDEADRVARTVRAWTTEGIPREEILVVVRSLQSETAGRVLDALRRLGVPTRRMGRRPLVAIPAARSALRLFRLLASAEEPGDALAALRSGGARDVSDDDADRLVLRAREFGAGTLEAVERLAAGDAAAPDRVPRLASVLAWCAALRARRPSPAPAPPPEVAERLLAGLAPLLRFSFEGGGGHSGDDGLRCGDGHSGDDGESRAAEDAAALRTLLDSVRDVVHALRAAGQATATPGDIARRVAVACEDARVAVPDLRCDAVNVVGAEEARQWEARAVVVCGLRLGEWPGGAREDLFLSDAERAQVEKQGGLALPQRMDEALRRERLLFYFAATRATERVVFTAPLADGKGDPVLRSPFLDDAMSILAPAARRLDGAHRSPGDLRPEPGETLHRSDLERVALAALTERFAAGTESERRPHTGYALLSHLVGAENTGRDGRDGRGGGVIREAARWFAPSPAALADDSAARLKMGRPRARSATALSSFAQCAYRHFASSGLGLTELPPSTEDGIDPLTAGHIAHAVLEEEYRHLPLDPARAAATFERIWGETAGRFRPGLRTASVRANLRRAVVEWVEGEAHGFLVPGFTPRHVEWAFGPKRATRVLLGGPETPVEISGSADRIDLSADGRAVVLDWKLSKAERFSGVEADIDAGSDLQLPMYALAVSRGLRVPVVAVGYVTLKDGKTRWLPISGDAPAATRPARRKLPTGWGEGDGGEAMSRAEAHVIRLDASIRSGRIDVDPLDEDQCGYCPFADLCRFEGKAK